MDVCETVRTLSWQSALPAAGFVNENVHIRRGQREETDRRAAFCLGKNADIGHRFAMTTPRLVHAFAMSAYALPIEMAGLLW